LGIDAVGHRRKLLNAIAALRADADVKAASPDAFPTIDGSAKDTAERRQVTVMFSDLVGSTTLSARMDPEDLREVISAYQKCVAETVHRFDGFVARYMGDGVLVYFGYPQAHEDDVERAIRAGLELITAVAALKSLSLRTRVGIATGLVVVGDLFVGSAAAQERGIVGETPNLAARLQEIAEPNMVVICDRTRRLLGNLFELEDLGPRDLKGLARPARAWAALRASSVASRFEALHAIGLTALVGREEEFELLRRCFFKATDLTTNPAISIPCGVDEHTIPFGLQVTGRFRGDRDLVDAAEAMEKAFANIPGLGRPRPDLGKLVKPTVDLKSIATHPPLQ
jgi:class 3 adenylate cyclase